ncbi:hypothetical protein [Mycolicibacterium wolinskyi]|uniref:hypothetical protein n=1 Tax=Mycolicibacterium wolinskyi TaxID=59750 RepID=UPI003917745E
MSRALAVLACIVAFAGVGCASKMGNDELAREVQRVMQHKIDMDPKLPYVRIDKVTLIESSGNQYKGLATVRSRDGAEREISVDVTYDGENLLWQTAPGAFVFGTG